MPRAIHHRIRKAWSVPVDGLDEPCVEYAPDAKAARSQAISGVRDAWSISFKDALYAVGSPVRAMHLDVSLPSRHPLSDSLNPKILHCVSHAYGGKGLRAGYRDHYYAGAEDWVMRAALYHGLFKVCRRDKGRDGHPDMIVYVLTALGRNVAAGEVKTYPEHD